MIIGVWLIQFKFELITASLIDLQWRKYVTDLLLVSFHRNFMLFIKL